VLRNGTRRRTRAWHGDLVLLEHYPAAESFPDDGEKRRPETYTTEEMTALLNEWARVAGSYSMYAAMHLLT
jgi:hypothetical protein